MPIYFWTTYEPTGDGRDGVLLIFGKYFCPTSWVVGLVCFVQTYRSGMVMSLRKRVVFWRVAFIPLAAIFSTLLPVTRALL